MYSSSLRIVRIVLVFWEFEFIAGATTISRAPPAPPPAVLFNHTDRTVKFVHRDCMLSLQLTLVQLIPMSDGFRPFTIPTGVPCLDFATDVGVDYLGAALPLYRVPESQGGVNCTFGGAEKTQNFYVYTQGSPHDPYIYFTSPDHSVWLRGRTVEHHVCRLVAAVKLQIIQAISQAEDPLRHGVAGAGTSAVEPRAVSPGGWGGRHMLTLARRDDHGHDPREVAVVLDGEFLRISRGICVLEIELTPDQVVVVSEAMTGEEGFSVPRNFLCLDRTSRPTAAYQPLIVSTSVPYDRLNGIATIGCLPSDAGSMIYYAFPADGSDFDLRAGPPPPTDDASRAVGDRRACAPVAVARMQIFRKIAIMAMRKTEAVSAGDDDSRSGVA